MKHVFGIVCILLLLTAAGCLSEKKSPASVVSIDSNSGIAIPGSDTPAEAYSINAPGMYYLAGNRLCANTGIDVNAHNVTIDLMGHTLIGPGKGSGLNYGIRTNNYQNLEVRNGTIRDFGDRGIVDRGKKQPTGYKRIVNVRVLNNGKCGICIGGPANLIKDCTCVNNGATGICPGYRCKISGNLCYGNAHDGINAGRGCNITENNIAENGQSGILAYCGSLIADNCVYMNNRSEDPNHAGIVIMNGCYVRDNVLRDNRINNILVKEIGNTIQDNVITMLHYPGEAISLLSDNNNCVNNHTVGDTVILEEKD